MRIVADEALCEGYANCLIAAPDVFDLGTEGKVVVLSADIADEARDAVDEAVRNCPVRALRWSDDA